MSKAVDAVGDAVSAVWSPVNNLVDTGLTNLGKEVDKKIPGFSRTVTSAARTHKDVLNTYLNPYEVIRNPLNMVTKPLTSGIEGAKNSLAFADDLGGTLGVRKSSAQKAAQAAEDDANNETAARAGAYQDALGDANIDTTTQGQITQAYNAGGSSAQIAGIVSAARQGKGVYGVRRINQNQQMLQAQNPGRSQTLGGGSLL